MALKNRQEYRYNRMTRNTYAAVAAKTSCLFALVHKLNATENAIVNRKMISILIMPVFLVQNNAMTGAMSSTTARTVMMRREKTSIRFLEYSRTSLLAVLPRSRFEMKSRCACQIMKSCMPTQYLPA